MLICCSGLFRGICRQRWFSITYWMLLPLLFVSFVPLSSKAEATRVFWGDSHLHTQLSLDAGLTGTRLGLNEAYRFARGERIRSSLGISVQLDRPLDWLAITDHSDGLGVIPELANSESALLADEQIWDWSSRFVQGGADAQAVMYEMGRAMTTGDLPGVVYSQKYLSQVWTHVVDAADQFYDPGRFTTLVGYEWTPTTGGNNLHRNVLYREGGKLAKSIAPFTARQSDRPEDLWSWMSRYESKTGGRVLAIPHNGNLSNGLMFPLGSNPATNAPITAEYAAMRGEREPLYEVTQMKGDSEAHPLLSPNDEFAGFENWDKYNLGLVDKNDAMLHGEYAREALKRGLQIQAAVGINPYRFGLLGSTDSHTGLSTAEERNFTGSLAMLEPTEDKTSAVIGKVGDKALYAWEQVASGYAAVWAKANTREEIFAAMMRREVYATTGSRITLRFFGGWRFTEEDLAGHDFVSVGYEKGVPMGGEMCRSSAVNALPVFMLAAIRDSYGGHLDRIQIIKGWLGTNGEAREKVYNVVCSNRRVLRDGRCPLSNSSSKGTKSWESVAGESELSAIWIDHSFDENEAAFYYARVIEVPTPRWTTHDAARFNTVPPSTAPLFIRERAYSSPIWFNPEQALECGDL